jgi:FkbM family methyltransferase
MLTGAYLDSKFTRHTSKNVKTIFEVGARDGLDSIALSEYYEQSTVYTFECNPNTIETCINNLKNNPRINFYSFGLGDKKTKETFFPYMLNNSGASSFFKRIDFNDTQTSISEVEIDTISNFCKNNNIDSIDILCMDTQGFELNILKGAGDLIHKIKFIIIEEPKKEPNRTYLAQGHSKYLGAPSAYEIQDFLKLNNFIEIERIYENELEDNVMYENVSYQSNML